MSRLHILGGGPAGLATSYFAAKADAEFTMYEGSDRVGGNAITHKEGEFLFDSGAHRFHTKDPEMNEEIQEMMGDELLKCHVPSQIYRQKKYVDFPLSPLNLISALGPFTFAKAGLDLVSAQSKRLPEKPSFEEAATRAYGKSIASMFLLNYTSKLWGHPCGELSEMISGKRLKGLNFTTFAKEFILGSKAKTEHLDGKFLYPKDGYGQIMENFHEKAGKENVRLNCRITKIHWSGSRVTGMTLNDGEYVEVPEGDQVISSLPLPLLVKMLDPGWDSEISEALDKMKFRNVILVAQFVDKESLSPNGSIYFPGPSTPVTRVYEPRNRSPYMSPEGKTSVVAEIPCWPGDDDWNLDDETWLARIRKWMQEELGWWDDSQWIGGVVRRMPHAYPVILQGTEERLEAVGESLSKLENLSLLGRNGKFAYTHVHDLMREGKTAVAEYQAKKEPVAAAV